MSIVKEQPVSCNFIVVKPDNKSESTMSKSKVGKYDTRKKRTMVDFNFLAKTNQEPNLSLYSTMEDLMASSVQICIWEDSRHMRDNEMVRTVITKSQGTGINLDAIDLEFPSYQNSSVEESSEEGSEPFSDEGDEEGMQTSRTEDNLRSQTQNSQTEDSKTGNESSDESEGDEGQDSDGAETISSTQENRYKLLGETHIEFQAILKNIIQFVDRMGEKALEDDSGTISIGKSRKIEITFKDLSQNKWDIKRQDLWYYGRKVGEISLKIEAKNLPFVRQMTAGVLTGQGVRTASVRHIEEITRGFSFRKDLPEEMRDLVDYIGEFKKRDSTKKGHQKVSVYQMQSVCKETIIILKHSSKTSLVHNQYKSVSAEIKAQEIFIELANHCLTYVEFVDPSLKGKYFEIITLVFHRGELDLNQIGIVRKENKNKKLLKMKQKLLPIYQSLLYKSLDFSIEKLSRKAPDFYRRDCVVF